MAYIHRASYFLFLLVVGIFVIRACQNQWSKPDTERTQTMSDQKTSGQFTAHDKLGSPVIIEWQKTKLVAPEFAAATKSVWELTRKAFVPVEMQFLRAHPEVVGTEDYFKPFEPLFKNGPQAVDWNKVEETMEALLKSYQIFDASTLSAEIIAMYAQDIYYFVTVKDQQTNGLLGYITFIVQSNVVKGAMSIAVDPACRNRGLGKLIMSSILKIRPDIERFFLSTRVTNDTARKAYLSWGFTKDENPVVDPALNPKHWIFFKYEFNKSDILQKTAAGLKAV
jgi:GNAT superfamily N-acetyltransferase